MPRGKKTDAAQKYIDRKIHGYYTRIEALKEVVQEQKQTILEQQEIIKELESTIAEQKTKLELFESVSKLSDSEIRTMLKKTESLNAIAGVLKMGGRYF